MTVLALAAALAPGKSALAGNVPESKDPIKLAHNDWTGQHLSTMIPGGRVRGMDGLRVVDASIIPSILSANLNAPTIMLAEKIADRVRGREPLPPERAPFHHADDYETRQR